LSLRVRTWLREPLLQFLAIGLLLFAVYHVRRGGIEKAEPSRRIEITSDDLRQIQVAWLAQGRPALTPAELASLVDDRVHEEILYREALSLGLDKGDTIVRRRLAQKIEFLFEDVAALREPTAQDLKTWHDAHPERFTEPPRATFRHLYFSPDSRPSRARDDASAVLGKASGKPIDWSGDAAGSDAFMFPDYYGDEPFDAVARTFGPGFAKALFQQPVGRWSGPIESGYGWHLVFIDSMAPPRVPPLEEIESQVKSDWIEDQRARMREAAYAVMKARYEVAVPKDLAAALAALPPLPAEAPQAAAVVPQ
jgi:hypothetical protein